VLLTHPLYTLGMLYLVAMVLRAVLSWFPVQHGSPVATVNHWLVVITEPVVAPFRKIIPPMGMFDISFIVAFLVVYVVTTYILVLVTI